MDSLTQIVLGAGVGELILGRKLGNRAMVWGAIAATIPDLDVFSSPFFSPAEGLRTHRGFSHSIFFALLAPLLYALLIEKLYSSGFYLRAGWKWAVYVLGILGIFFVGILPGAISLYNTFAWWSWLLAGLGLFLGWVLFSRYGKNYFRNSEPIDLPSYSELYWFFFWTTVTHPILDCFTVYGTQLFAPLSRIRISWDNISVVDPAYTLLFGIPLVISALYSRQDKLRLVFCTMGLVLSTLYLNGTFHTKNKVNHIIESSLSKNRVEYSRFMNNPTIFNNILWTSTVETKEAFLFGNYSLLDKSENVIFKSIPKNYDLLSAAKEDDYDVNTIKWFSKGYYTVLKRKDGRLQVNDMRYGTFGGDGSNPDDYIFRFILNLDKNGYYHIDQRSQAAPNNMKKAFSDLFKRLKGI